MAKNLQQNKEQKGPFSPLQSGCAFVMLSNMLLYLIVVAFTFNLLDPSKINADYLAKRGLTARPTPEREEDKTFRRLSAEKRQEQQKAQAEIIESSRLGIKEEASLAAKLSEVGVRPLASSQPDEPEKPKAALTQSPQNSGKTTVRTASSRLFSLSVFPQVTLPQTYSPYRPLAARTIIPEKYETMPVELAPGIDFPTFSLPMADPAGAYLYTPPNPIPEASRGGLKLSSPPVGANPPDTNGTENTKEPQPAGQPAKDKL